MTGQHQVRGTGSGGDYVRVGGQVLNACFGSTKVEPELESTICALCTSA